MTCLTPSATSGRHPGRASLQFPLPVSELNHIDLISGGFNCNYNGLQVTATQRTSHGLSITTGYLLPRARYGFRQLGKRPADSFQCLRKRQGAIVGQQRFRHPAPVHTLGDVGSTRDQDAGTHPRGMVHQFVRYASDRHSLAAGGSDHRHSRRRQLQSRVRARGLASHAAGIEADLLDRESYSGSPPDKGGPESCFCPRFVRDQLIRHCPLPIGTQ